MARKVTWSAEKYQRLLAATVAAHPELKLVRTLATFFGAFALTLL
jgi:hypothetical protein